MKFERKRKKGKKAFKACDLKRKHPGTEEMGMLVKSSQASVHCAIVAKAAKRALRIPTVHSNYRDLIHEFFVGGKHHPSIIKQWVIVS